MQLFCQLGIDGEWGPLYNGKGRGYEVHQVPSPCVIPKGQSLAAPITAAMWSSAAARDIGLLLAISVSRN